MKKVLIAAFGTRGDVQPAIVLANELTKLNISVSLAVEPMHLEFVRSHKITAIAIGTNTNDTYSSAIEVVLRDPSLDRRNLLLPSLLQDFQTESITSQLVDLTENYDFTLYNGLLFFALANPVLANRHGGVWYCGPYSEEWLQWPNPCPGKIKFLSFDGDFQLSGDYRKFFPEETICTGFWLKPEVVESKKTTNQEPSDQYIVYFGLGSSFLKQKPELVEIFLDVIGQLNLKAVIQGKSGWYGQLPEFASYDDDVEHTKTLPNVDLVVHHGGSGTTAAVLRAKKPSLILPQWGDQPAWAEVLFNKGYSIGTILPHELSFETLHESLKNFRELNRLKSRQWGINMSSDSFNGANLAALAIGRELGLQ